MNSLRIDINNNTKTTRTKDLRIFATIWSGIFLVLSIKPLLHNGLIIWWMVLLSLSLILTSVFIPKILFFPFKIWEKIGEIMGHITSTVILFLIFCFVFTPFGIISRLAGKDFLSKKIDKNSKSYWFDRLNQPTSLKNQF